ncbi:MAG: hypothetical protein ACTHML_11730 [Ginsengibacter sp.]
MELGLIELTKESALGSQRSIRSLKKITNHQYKKHPWPDLPIPQLAADFF